MSMSQTLAEQILAPFGGYANNCLNNLICDLNTPPSYYYEPDTFLNTRKITNQSTNQFTTITVNSQCLRSKLTPIKLFLHDALARGDGIDCLCIQETWSSEEDTELQIPGYRLAHNPNRINRCGGLCIYIKDVYNYKVIHNDFISDYFESQIILIETQTNSKENSIVIANIYRPPRTDVTNFTEFNNDFSNLLSALRRYPNVVIAGDFNINLLKYEEKPSFTDYLDNIRSLGYTPSITLPTRISSSSCTLIDNLFIKITPQTQNTTSGVILTSFSDHFACFTTTNINTNFKKPPRYIEIRSESDHSVRLIRHDIERAQIMNNLNTNPTGDPNTNYNILHNNLQSIINKHITVTTIRFKKHRHKHEPWITHGIIKSIKTKDKLLCELRKTNKIHSTILYDFLANKLKHFTQVLKKVIRTAKRMYFTNYFEANKSNMKKTWSKINEVIGKKKIQASTLPSFEHNNSIINDPLQIASHFNAYFATIGPKLASSIETNNIIHPFQTYLGIPPNSHFTFHEVTEAQVKEIIKDINVKNSFGHDKISTRLLIKLIPSFITEITLIINQCIRSGTFPNLLKLAKVIPIYKKDNPSNFGNYRPISILPSMSKVIEKVIYLQINAYFKTNNLYFDSQHGFRKNHSCETAAIELIDQVTRHLDHDQSPISIFIDLSNTIGYH